MQSMIILGAGMVGGVMAEDLVADEGAPAELQFACLLPANVKCINVS